MDVNINNFYYTAPIFFEMEFFQTDDEVDVNILKEKFRIEIIGRTPNSVFVHPKFKTTSIVKLIMKGTNNTVYIGKPIKDSCQLQLHAEFHHNNSTLIIADQHHWPIRLSLISYSNDQLVVWGKGATTNGTSITVQFPEKVVAVGDDCMFATDTWMRNSDMHGLYDLTTGNKINKPGNIIIQPHVWVGQYAYMVGDVLAGYGTTIGAQSLVKGNLDPCSVYAGSPAKKIKENTTWNREPVEKLPDEVNRLLEQYKNKLNCCK